MKFLKLSLAASVALGAFSTASFAQPLEEAIKGVDVKGFLRYRYTDDRYDNRSFNPTNKNGSAFHQWRAQADLKTPVINNMSLALGIYYNNDRQNVNHGKGVDRNPDGSINDLDGVGTSLGSGLGSGKDGNFGVSIFHATLTPDNTATTVVLGKQRLATPLTNSGDDRGTGFLISNKDIRDLTVIAGAFDSWSLDNWFKGYRGNESSVDKPFYMLAAVYNTQTQIGNIGAQAWGIHANNLIDASGFLELSWSQAFLNVKLQYALAKLDNGKDSMIHHAAGTSGATLPIVPTHRPTQARGLNQGNDVLSFQVSANFKKDFNLPLDARLGYITNFQDGTVALLDDEGSLAKTGKLWFGNGATGITFGLGSALGGFYGSSRIGRGVYGQESSIGVLYGAVGYSFIEDRLKLGLEAVYGTNKRTWASTAPRDVRGKDVLKTKFTEITPTISWKHNKNLDFSAYYAMLTTKNDLSDSSPDEKRNRARVQVRYSF